MGEAAPYAGRYPGLRGGVLCSLASGQALLCFLVCDWELLLQSEVSQAFIAGGLARCSSLQPRPHRNFIGRKPWQVLGYARRGGGGGGGTVEMYVRVRFAAQLLCTTVEARVGGCLADAPCHGSQVLLFVVWSRVSLGDWYSTCYDSSAMYVAASRSRHRSSRVVDPSPDYYGVSTRTRCDVVGGVSERPLGILVDR